jgi:hypothetical protein
LKRLDVDDPTNRTGRAPFRSCDAWPKLTRSRSGFDPMAARDQTSIQDVEARGARELDRRSRRLPAQGRVGTESSPVGGEANAVAGR